MSDLNVVILQGRVTSEVESRGDSDNLKEMRAKFTMSSFVYDTSTPKGEKSPPLNVQVAAEGYTAKTITNYVSKDQFVIVKGELRSRIVGKRDGENVYGLIILAKDIQLGKTKKKEKPVEDSTPGDDAW